ncbi:potassium-transporting ATPase subunit KdpC [Lacipirellula sp.]|uniref:potassium-transporting ATPase subunit KdpC n=1 Tax=Lacipirellula sp. TaxID=2691419 RepID=UPI003D0E1282
MLSQFRPALVVFLALTVVTGVAYPVVVTVFANVVFPRQAQGSLIEVDGKAVGSSLIGQGFTDTKYFWGRPSAASYNGAASTGSNLGPTNPAQLDAVKGRIEAMQAAHGAEKRVPIDLVTASGSGLDPHISPAAIEYQLERVAKQRGMTVDEIRPLVAQATAGRTFGLLGEPRVNVLELNLALDAAQSAD